MTNVILSDQSDLKKIQTLHIHFQALDLAIHYNVSQLLSPDYAILSRLPSFGLTTSTPPSSASSFAHPSTFSSPLLPSSAPIPSPLPLLGQAFSRPCCPDQLDQADLHRPPSGHLVLFLRDCCHRVECQQKHTPFQLLGEKFNQCSNSS